MKVNVPGIKEAGSERKTSGDGAQAAGQTMSKASEKL